MDDIKFDRIKRIIKDLEYELASGLHQNLIDEQISAEFLIGAVSRDYPAWQFKRKFKPITEYELILYPLEKRFEGLTLVKG